MNICLPIDLIYSLIKKADSLVFKSYEYNLNAAAVNRYYVQQIEIHLHIDRGKVLLFMDYIINFLCCKLVTII